MSGTVTGKVFRDTDRDGVLDTGEPGIQNVWVGVTTDGGLTVPGYAWTDVNGIYSITVPANDPPRTTPYSVMIIPPAGFFPTSSTAINGIYLQAGQTLSSQNFGVASFTVINLEANRVLCLKSGDLIEKDWNGSHTENAHGDADLILGSDTGGSDQISIWFNQYSSTPLFDEEPDYTRSAPGAVVSMALDFFNIDSPLNRPDLVTGCKTATAGNFFVWWCQNTSGNEGYFPAHLQPGLPDDRQRRRAGPGEPGLRRWRGRRLPGHPRGHQVAHRLPGQHRALDEQQRDEPDLLAHRDLSDLRRAHRRLARRGDRHGPRRLRRRRPAGPRGGHAHGHRRAGLLPAEHGQDRQPALRRCRRRSRSTGEAVTALAALDVDGDGLLDVVAGTQTTASGGRLIFLKNRPAPGAFDIAQRRERPRRRHRRWSRPTSAAPRAATWPSAGARARRATSAA